MQGQSLGQTKDLGEIDTDFKHAGTWGVFSSFHQLERTQGLLVHTRSEIHKFIKLRLIATSILRYASPRLLEYELRSGRC